MATTRATPQIRPEFARNLTQGHPNAPKHTQTAYRRDVTRYGVRLSAEGGGVEYKCHSLTF